MGKDEALQLTPISQLADGLSAAAEPRSFSWSQVRVSPPRAPPTLTVHDPAIKQVTPPSQKHGVVASTSCPSLSSDVGKEEDDIGCS